MSLRDRSHEKPQISGTMLPATEPPARQWDRRDLEADWPSLFYDLSDLALTQIAAALDFADRNGLTVETVEQEDFRIPALAHDVASLRESLDTGRGFRVIRGLDVINLPESQAEIVSWGICNYLGRPIRQGISHDRRFFTVVDKGAANTDPTRIGASPKRSAKHSDNGCLEPRAPDYLGLFCYRSATEGGDSTIVSARTIYEIILRERPDILPLLFKTYHFRAPQAHVWPSRGPTVEKPILEMSAGELRIAYARVMIEPGMEMAGTPLSADEREALDYLDDVIERPEANFRHVLQPGELLMMNNRVLLHGREPFPAGTAGGRTLKRFWMWRRHIGPGDDPALLDLEEFA
ncbi:MAG: TauD/TfdA family dioxygenase [Roseibium sp.]|nr:TauD/TfdA family dioxygenase [Roseibium sp.]